MLAIIVSSVAFSLANANFCCNIEHRGTDFRNCRKENGGNCNRRHHLQGKTRAGNNIEWYFQPPMFFDGPFQNCCITACCHVSFSDPNPHVTVRCNDMGWGGLQAHFSCKGDSLTHHMMPNVGPFIGVRRMEIGDGSEGLGDGKPTLSELYFKALTSEVEAAKAAEEERRRMPIWTYFSDFGEKCRDTSEPEETYYRIPVSQNCKQIGFDVIPTETECVMAMKAIGLQHGSNYNVQTYHQTNGRPGGCMEYTNHNNGPSKIEWNKNTWSTWTSSSWADLFQICKAPIRHNLKSYGHPDRSIPTAVYDGIIMLGAGALAGMFGKGKGRRRSINDLFPGVEEALLELTPDDETASTSDGLLRWVLKEALELTDTQYDESVFEWMVKMTKRLIDNDIIESHPDFLGLHDETIDEDLYEGTAANAPAFPDSLENFHSFFEAIAEELTPADSLEELIPEESQE